MKWKADYQYQIGEVRTTRKFAYLPTRVGAYIVWLEFFYIKKKSSWCSRIDSLLWTELERWCSWPEKRD